MFNIESNVFLIEKNIPVPSRHDRNSFPFPKMKVGDSFFVPLHKYPNITCNQKLSQYMSGAGSKWASNLCNGSKFSVRQVAENNIKGVRVWRVK